jgi:hypothetical protein
VFALLSCEEVLPPRDDPENVLEVSMSIESALFKFVETNRILGSGGIFPSDSFAIDNVGILFAISNHHDEVLQGLPYLKGELEIQVRNDPTRRGTLMFEGGVVFPPSVIQEGMLTIVPGDTAFVQLSWNHYFRPGVPAWERDWFDGSMTYRHEIDRNGNRWDVFRSSPIVFEVRGKLQAFENLQAESLKRTEFTGIYDVYRIWVP